MRYVVAAMDMTPFIVKWLNDLSRPDAPSRGLLDYVDEDYDYGASFMMSNVAPEATKQSASSETLLLFAVLAVYQHAEHPDRPAKWEGPESHLAGAFNYAQALGDSGVAAALLKYVADRSKRQTPPMLRELRERSMNRDPAKLAQHDRNMAEIEDRSIRAARLLDPALTLEQFLFD